MVDALPLGVFVLGSHGRPTYANPAALDMLHQTQLPDCKIEALAEVCQAYRSPTEQLYPTAALPIVRALRGEACEVGDLVLRQGAQALPLRVWATPVRDSAGQVQFAVATFTALMEATPPLLADPRSAATLDQELRTTSKFELVGQLAAGVAHEINTPMQYIGDNTAFLGVTVKRLLELAGSFEELLVQCSTGNPSPLSVERGERLLQKARVEFLREQAPSAVEQSLAGIAMVRSIVYALNEFCHPGEEQPVALDLNHLARMAGSVTRNVWKCHATLTLELDESLVPLQGYPQELGQVLINLIVNAAHAIEDCPRHRGRLGSIVLRSSARDGVTEIQVEDDGAGIADCIKARVMDPFFTTKPPGKGTGQGLALARSVIVDRHAGSLSFQSTVGIGTTFFIRLGGQANGSGS
jgi:signal transduction histidine kinase